jgi:hypothetical protein
MPLKLDVGLSKKIGMPHYGSIGASCHVEVELESSLLPDPDAFQERTKRAFNACRQAVNDELARHKPSGDGRGVQRPAAPSAGNSFDAAAQTGNGTGTNVAGKGSPQHRVSTKQLDFAQTLAGEIRGLEANGLERLAQKLYGKPLNGLSSLDASGLIATLKSIKAGDIDVDVALNGAAA